jgi:hypothetical protein
MLRIYTLQPWPYLLLVLWLGSASLGLSACSSTPNAWIEYTRSGGFLGLDDHLTIQTSGEVELTRRAQAQAFTLNAAQMAKLQTGLDEAAFATLQTSYMPTTTGGDRIEYTVRVAGKTVKTADGTVPAVLQPLLAMLNQVVESQGISQGVTP